MSVTQRVGWGGRVYKDKRVRKLKNLTLQLIAGWLSL